MSAADRMVVRTRSGEIRSIPRRQALALIAAGRAEAERRSRPAEPIRQPDPGIITGTPETITTKMDEPTGAPRAVPRELVEEDHPELGPALAALTLTSASTAPGLQYVSGTEDADVPTVEAVPLPLEPKPSARRGEWAEYADSLGIEVTSVMTKRDIQQAAEEAAQSLSNLPQPALTGGRLETPEDEPVTDGSVTDDEDSRTQ